MSTFTFGSFAVDMTSDELTTPAFTSFFPSYFTLDGPNILSASLTEIVSQDPDTLAIFVIRGYFDPAAPLSTRVTGLRAETATGQLIFDFSGFSVSLEQATSLLPGELNTLILGGNDVITGSLLADHLLGYGGNDRIDGGAGADVLEGGLGNDTYVLDDPGDSVVEFVNQGIDTVRSPLAHVLGANVENLVLTGLDPVSGTGNALNNLLNGVENPAANALAGGAGDDTYEVDPGDSVLELPGEGLDTLRSNAAAVVLPENVENAVLLNPGAAATGNSAPNAITGAAGANTLDGGRGPDSLAGLGGNDTYHVDNGADVVSEAASAGIDTIATRVGLTLPANVEHGTVAAGLGAVALTGNALANELVGNDGANVLDGLAGNDRLAGAGGDDTLLGGDGNDLLIGGAGRDVLLGGAGADRFRFDAAPDGGNVDRIMDFLPGVDDLEFSAAVFAGLGAPGSAVTAAVFVKGVAPVATDPEDRLLYDTSSGRLYYDADGSADELPALIATLQGAPNLAASDLLVVT